MQTEKNRALNLPSMAVSFPPRGIKPALSTKIILSPYYNTNTGKGNSFFAKKPRLRRPGIQKNRPLRGGC
jgi:hypothetical protein